MSALRLCLLWQAPESQRPQRAAPGLCLLPLCRHRCLSLRGPPPLSQHPGADGSSGAGGLAGSLCPLGASRTVGPGVYPSPPHRWPGAAAGAYRLIHTAVSFASFFLITLVETRLNAALLGAWPPGKMQDYPLHVLERQVGKLRQGLARLIDSYAEGLIDKQEFEPRVTRLRQRIAHVEAQ